MIDLPLLPVIERGPRDKIALTGDTVRFSCDISKHNNNHYQNQNSPPTDTTLSSISQNNKNNNKYVNKNKEKDTAANLQSTSYPKVTWYRDQLPSKLWLVLCLTFWPQHSRKNLVWVRDISFGAKKNKGWTVIILGIIAENRHSFCDYSLDIGSLDIGSFIYTFSNFIVFHLGKINSEKLINNRKVISKMFSISF